MSEEKHTALPWAYNTDGLVWSTDAALGVYNVVCRTDNPANAALIVRAVNAHAALLAAVRVFLGLIERNRNPTPREWIQAEAQARAAVALAHGGES